jgi:hypothetical protein
MFEAVQHELCRVALKGPSAGGSGGKSSLAELDRQEQAHASVDLSLLEAIPPSKINLARLSRR